VNGELDITCNHFPSEGTGERAIVFDARGAGRDTAVDEEVDGCRG
jgi:hypothetical protein